MLKQSYHVLVMTLSRLLMRYPQTQQDTCKAIYQRFVSTAKFAPGMPLPQSRAHKHIAQKRNKIINLYVSCHCNKSTIPTILMAVKKCYCVLFIAKAKQHGLFGRCY